MLRADKKVGPNLGYWRVHQPPYGGIRPSHRLLGSNSKTEALTHSSSQMTTAVLAEQVRTFGISKPSHEGFLEVVFGLVLLAGPFVSGGPLLFEIGQNN